MKELKLIANWDYAGTNKFVSHALKDDTHGNEVTYCGLHLKYHQKGDWEELETEESGPFPSNQKITEPGCLKCQKAMDAAKRLPQPGSASVAKG